ncbi:MAG: hypothetical protein ACYTG0_41760 [Planctomycetota bacterium]
MNRHFLRLAVIGLTSFASQAGADGLIYRLPADGAWVRYQLSEEGYATITFPPGANVPPWLKKAQELPVKVAGFLSLRSVGQRDLDGERCRWIEMEFRAELVGKRPNPATGELQEKKGKRHIILKMLVPEEYLSAGADPMAHVRKLYFKDGEKEPELVEDEKAKQYQLDRFRPVFPAPARKVDRSQKQRVETPNDEIGTLECEKHVFDSKYEGPLTGGRRGWWSWHGKHEVCLHEKVPFGVVSLKLAGESHEWSGDKERSPGGAVKSTKEMVVAEVGARAKSELPECD